MKSTPPSLFPLNCFVRRDILMHVNACEHSIYLGRVPHSFVLSFCSLLLSASTLLSYVLKMVLLLSIWVAFQFILLNPHRHPTNIMHILWRNTKTQYILQKSIHRWGCSRYILMNISEVDWHLAVWWGCVAQWHGRRSSSSQLPRPRPPMC